jgi:hypothetical protein
LRPIASTLDVLLQRRKAESVTRMQAVPTRGRHAFLMLRAADGTGKVTSLMYQHAAACMNVFVLQVQQSVTVVLGIVALARPH